MTAVLKNASAFGDSLNSNTKSTRRVSQLRPGQYDLATPTRSSKRTRMDRSEILGMNGTRQRYWIKDREQG